MTRKRIKRILLAAAFAALLLASAETWAQKAKKPPVTPPPRFALLELPVEGHPYAISESTSGALTVAVDSSEEGYSSAAFVRLDPATREILDYGFLPEPPFADPNDGAFINGYSGPSDVNDAGIIVGSAGAYEGDPDYTGDDINPNRGIVWTYDAVAESYSYELLPTLNLDPAYAASVNNLGFIVGGSGGRAVLWDATTHAIEDLNTEETAALGWELSLANDINDDGLIVGSGMLFGKTRGFLLDCVSGAIVPVPLIGPADANSASRINASGRVVGHAWNGSGIRTGTTPDYVRGFSWDGPLSAPIALTSVTKNTSLGIGMNDLGASTGISYIPTDDWLSNDTVPTLWELDDLGQLTATDLTTEIESSRSWFLLSCGDVNNDGWISARARKQSKGSYLWPAVLLIPNQ